MNGNEQGSENFTSLATRLGLSPAELLVVTHKIGLSIFDLNYGSLELDPMQIAAIHDHVSQQADSATVSDSKRSKKKTKKQQLNTTKTKKRDEKEEDPISIEDFVSFFNVSSEILMQLCKDNDIVVGDVKQHLSKANRRTLSSLLYAHSLNVVDHDDAEVFIPIVEVKKLDVEHSAPVAIKRAANKRISVLCRETETDEATLRYVIDALQIRIIHDRFEKIEVRHEDEIKTAITLMKDLPTERTERGEMRLKGMAAKYQVPVFKLADLCAEHGIPTRHKRYVSTHGALRLATLLSDSEILRRLHHPDLIHDESMAVDVVYEEVTNAESVNYQGISLARQNFKDFSFEKSDMRQVDLSHSILVDANLKSVDAREGQFIRAQAANANFSAANVSDANFDHADLSRSIFVNATCEGTIFANANLQRADFSGANLTGADARWANFSGAIFSNTIWINGLVINHIDETTTA